MRPMNELEDENTVASWAGGAAVTAGILLVLAVSQAVL